MPFSKHVPFFALVVLLLANTRCNTQPAPPISGKITLSEGWKPVVYLVQPRRFAEIAANYSGVVIDSATIAPDGRFAFSHVVQTEDPALFQLCVQRVGNRFSNQLLDDNPLTSNYMPLILSEKQAIVLEAEAARFQATYSISQADAQNRALLQLRDIRHQSRRTWEQNSGTEAADELNLLAHEEALRQFQLPLMNFADSCASLLPALLAIRWVSPESDYERVPELLFSQCRKWSAAAPGNPWVAQLCQAAQRDKLPVLQGDTIPDFALPMAGGDTVFLRRLLGQKITVLDIWASWCAPCRRENREVLAPLWKQYQAAGLQIIGYSIDSSPAAWKAAIAKDGAAWPHASHLSGDATPFMEALRINTIPANFILDAQGKVLAKNLHGAALHDFIEHYLKN